MICPRSGISTLARNSDGCIDRATASQIRTSVASSIAQDWAKANGKTTLEQTRGGKVLDKMDLFGKGSPVSGAQAKEIWDIASKRFADGASGEVNVFSTGATRFSPFSERTWWKIERDALMKNSAVRRITRRKKDGTPSVNGRVCK